MPMFPRYVLTEQERRDTERELLSLGTLPPEHAQAALAMLWRSVERSAYEYKFSITLLDEQVNG